MNADYGKWEVLLFQFYDSPIKSNGNFPLFRYILGFNSMIVRLKVWTVRGYNPVEGGFNSMIVRLKVFVRQDVHNFRSCFNSMIVRLKVRGLDTIAR